MSGRGSRPMRSTRRLSNLGQRPRWYTVKNQSEDGTKPTLIYIFDEIGFWGVSASDFVADLAQAGDGDLEMHINSPGGDIFDAIAIYNVLKQRSGLLTVVVQGLAASAASFLAQAASPNQLYIAPHAQMMVHDGFAMAIGNAADMRETADLLDKASDNIAAIYAERTGRDQSYWRDKMRAETWFSDQEAVDHGLADAIHGVVEGATNTWDLGVFLNFRPAGAATANHGPYKGAHSHVHPAYGAGDGESHEHEHEHNNDKDHSAGRDMHSHASLQPTDSLSQLILNAAVDESTWDRDRAMHEAAESDSPAKAYAKICAGRREGPADEGESWALPHHYPDKDAPNAAGVRNALARFDSTQGLTNTDAAKAHLTKHMKAINPDWEPDDKTDFGLLLGEIQEALR